MHRLAWMLGIDFVFRFWAVSECPHSITHSQCQRILSLFPAELLGGNLFPGVQKGSIFCLLVRKIKAHSQVSKIISSRKNPDGRLTYLCGVLYNSLKTYNQFFCILLPCAVHSFKEMHKLDAKKCMDHRSTALRCSSVVRIRLSKYKQLP